MVAASAGFLVCVPEIYPRELAGRLDEHLITSALLADNPLGDPADRPLYVYVPPGYDAEPNRRLPSIYVIQGYTGAVPMWHNRSPFRPTPSPSAVSSSSSSTSAADFSCGSAMSMASRRRPGG